MEDVDRDVRPPEEERELEGDGKREREAERAAGLQLAAPRSEEERAEERKEPRRGGDEERELDREAPAARGVPSMLDVRGFEREAVREQRPLGEIGDGVERSACETDRDDEPGVRSGVAREVRDQPILSSGA